MLVITQLEFGGAQKALSVLAQGLIANGHQVDLYCLYDKGNFVHEFQKKYNVNYKPLIKNYEGNILKKSGKFILMLYALFKIIKNGNYAVVQTFTHYSNIIIPLVSKFASNRTKVITSQRASIKPLGKLVVFADRLVQNSFLVDKMTCVSQSIYHSCINDEKIIESKLKVIPNGISLPESKISRVAMRNYFSIAHDDIVFITVARFHEQKGYKFLVEAIKKIKDNCLGSNFKFIFVGGGQLKEKIMKSCNEFGLNEKIIFAGERDDVPDLLNMSDVFILPSLWEGMPNSVLEAMASGTCVIATGVDGTKELIDIGVHGVLVPPGDIESLYDSICFIGENDEKRRIMAQNGMMKVKNNYTNESTIASYLKLYNMEINS